MTDILYDTQQAAAFYGISEVTLRTWRVTGSGPIFLKVGKSVRYRLSDLDAYLAGRTYSNTTEVTFSSAGVA